MERSVGPRNIGEERKRIKWLNCQKVFDAVFESKAPVTTTEILKGLEEETKALNYELEKAAQRKYENGELTEAEKTSFLQRSKKRTMHRRTVERCLRADKRIKVVDGSFYVTDDVKFRMRALRPREFGSDLLDKLIQSIQEKKSYPVKDKKRLLMKKLVVGFGTFMIFNFIEALRPVKKSSLSLQQKQGLTRYWLMNSIPIDIMFHTFEGLLASDRSDNVRQKITEAKITELSDMLRGLFPGHYRPLYIVRKKTFGKTTRMKTRAETGLPWSLIHDHVSGMGLSVGDDLKSVFRA